MKLPFEGDIFLRIMHLTNVVESVDCAEGKRLTLKPLKRGLKK